MIKILLAFFVLLYAATINAGIVVNIVDVASKSKNNVTKILGKPISCSKSKYGEKCQYKKGDTEIVFINNKADWITVNAMDGVVFSQSALSALGLKSKRPSFKNNFTIRWDQIQNLRSVSIFKGQKNVDYAYIKVKTN